MQIRLSKTFSSLKNILMQLTFKTIKFNVNEYAQKVNRYNALFHKQEKRLKKCVFSSLFT